MKPKNPYERIVAQYYLMSRRNAPILRFLAVGLGFLGVLFLVFYNLKFNPAPWHDEGAVLSVSKSIAVNTTYAGLNSEGYETFGAVQSVGPTVIVPIALVYKYFGVNLINGRIVSGVYTCFALWVFYLAGLRLFGQRSALIALVLLLGSPAPRFLYMGRQALGEVPALFFLLAGWLFWRMSITEERSWLSLVGGLFFGASMVTKSSFIPMVLATLLILFFLGRYYYKNTYGKSLAILGIAALIPVCFWVVWQVKYYSPELFFENIALLRGLASSTTGFNINTVFDGMKNLIGSTSGNFYLMWGLPSLFYGGVLCLKRNRDGFTMSFIFFFSLLWFGYYLWSVPWQSYLFPQAALAALFVGKLLNDYLDVLLSKIQPSIKDFNIQKLEQLALPGAIFLVLLLVMTYPLLNTLNDDVLTKYTAGHEMAVFINEEVPESAEIETWERELGILTEHQYHFPSQSNLVETHAAMYRDGPKDHALGEEYFLKFEPGYVVVGWFARWLGVYETSYLQSRGELLTTIGSYELYQLEY